MFCGDIVESLNYVFKDSFLTTSSRGGGRKATKEEKDEAMLRHAHVVQMGLLVLHGYVGGVIYYWDTLWILDMGSCLTPLGPTCLWRGLGSALCSYRTQALHGDVCLWRCRTNWSRLASQGEDVFFV